MKESAPSANFLKNGKEGVMNRSYPSFGIEEETRHQKADKLYGNQIEELKKLKRWVKKRFKEECSNRPDVNVYKKTLITTWTQIIRQIEKRIKYFQKNL